MTDTADTDSEKPAIKRFGRIRVYYRLHRKRILAAFVVIAHTAGALTSVEAIMQTRTPPGAVAWAISLNLFPYLAVPAYWAFGHTEFDKYNEVREDSYARFAPVREPVNESIEARKLHDTPDNPFAKTLESLADFGFTKGNECELLVNGDDTYSSMLEAIDAAEKYVLFQTYILRSDATGIRFKDLLLTKAREGVKVFVIYDEIGSLGLDETFTGELKDGGVHILPFSSTLADGRKYQLNFRNHRKIVVVDGTVGFVGGLNIGDEYLGKHEKLTPWRDTHMRVAGPAATLLQLPFAEDWLWAAGEVLDGLNWDLQASVSGESTVLVLPTGPADRRETSGLFFLAAINSAKERLWIATPYFVPDEQIISALKLAVLRGVDVRIIVPDLIDSTLVHFSSHSYLAEIHEAGIRAYRFDEGFLHQKVMLIDDDFSCVGSANMDNRSFRLNFEIVLAVQGQDFASKMGEMFDQDLANSTEIKSSALSGKPFYFRLASKVARLLAPIQ